MGFSSIGRGKIDYPSIRHDHLYHSFPLMGHCACMNSLSLAQDIFRDTAKTTRGQKFRHIAGRLNSKAQDIRRAADTAQDQEAGAAASADVQEDVMDVLDDTRTETRKDVDGVFAEANAEGKKKSDVLRETAEHLDTASGDLDEVASETNMENKQHDGDTLAQAQLGASGTETGDLEKMQGQESVVDKDVGIGAAAHERAHTDQEIQAVGSVTADAPPDEAPVVSSTLDDAPKEGEVTATQLEETGAIIEQKKAAPKSFEKLTEVYKDTYYHVLSYVPDESRIVELAQQSDGLETLQREYMVA